MNTLILALEHASLIGVLALIVVWLAQKLLENRVPATWRVWLWRVALLQTALAMLPLSPVTLAVLPSSPTPIHASTAEGRTTSSEPHSISTASDEVRVTAPTKATTSNAGVITPVEMKAKNVTTPSDSSRLEILKLWCYWNQDKIWLALQGIYFLGLGFYLLKMVRSFRRLQRVLRSSVRIEDKNLVSMLREVAGRLNVTSLPSLVQVEGGAPFLVGIARPHIVLPSINALNQRECEVILSHELAHLKRRDLVWNVLAWSVQTALWFHPLAWVSRYFLSLETESACDEMVLSSSHITPNFYGTLLLNTLRVERMPLTAGVTDGFSSLKARLVRLNHAPKHPRRAGRILFASALGLSVIMALPIRLVSRLQAAPREVLTPKRQDSEKKKALIAGIGIVRGTVFTPDGMPVKGARVSWVSYNGKKGDAEESILATTQSDEKGDFHFDNSKALLEKSLGFVGSSQRVQLPQLLAEAKGWGCFATPIANISPASRALHLTRPTELQATFLDPQGNPIANLPVRLSFVFFEKPEGRLNNFKYIYFGHLKYFDGVTDANGVFRMGGLPQGGRARLEIDDERFATLDFQNSDVNLARQAQNIAKPIRLEPGAIVRGRITTSESGKPVAGIRVGAQGQNPTNGWEEAISNSDGYYSMSMLRAGRYNLALDLDDETSTRWTARAHEGVSISMGSQQDNLDFQLEPGIVITGRVVTQGSDQPVEGATIGIYGPAHPKSSAWVQGATSLSDGSYQLRVPSGDQYIYISGVPEGFVRPGSQPVSTGEKHNAPYEFAAQQGQNETIDWQLKALPTARDVQVRVLDANGQPAKGAQVEFSVTGADDILDSDSEPQSTDAQGRTVLKNVRGSIQIRAQLGQSVTPQAKEALGGQSVTLNLLPNTLVGLEGNIVDEAGKPLSGIKVDLLRWKQDSGGVITSVLSDAQGHYNFAGLWPNSRYSLSISTPGYGQAQIKRFQLKPGETRTFKDIALLKATSFVEGSVVDSTNKPIPEITVWISGAKTGTVGAKTDAKGFFRSDAIVPNDQLMLTVSRDDSFGSADARSGATGTVIKIEKH